MRCNLTWKLKGTKYNRYYFQLFPSMHHTEEIASGLLPTPAAVDYKQTTLCESQRERNTLPGIMVKMFLLPTPVASEGYKLRGGETENQMSLTKMMRQGILPTPAANDCQMRYQTENWRGDDLVSTINEIHGTRSHLSPHFVMEMMGFPPNWTLSPFLNGETNPSKPEATQ